jgi:hypothetical protein
MHNKILREKRNGIDTLRIGIQKALSELFSKPDTLQAMMYRWQRDLVVDLQNISDWPFNLKNIVQPAVGILATLGVGVARIYWSN